MIGKNQQQDKRASKCSATSHFKTLKRDTEDGSSCIEEDVHHYKPAIRHKKYVI